MQMTAGTRTASLFLKAVTVIAAAVGVVLSALAGREFFMGGSRVFMYFTIQSNIAVALIALAGAVLLLAGRPLTEGWLTVCLVGAVAITLTGTVFTFVLAPTMGKYAWNLQNVLTHVAVPVAAVADFFVTAPWGVIRRRRAFWVILPPLAYAVYAGIGYVLGWEFAEGIRYPYFFLNWGSPAGAFGFTRELPFMGCAWWILALLALLLAAGFGYLRIAEGIRARRARRK